MIFYLTWKDLTNIKTIKSNNTYHYKTINNIHLEWARNGIYEKAYNQTLKDKNIKITENNFIVPFGYVYAQRAIDGTLIINKSGIEGIGYGCGESFLGKSLKIFDFPKKNTLLKKSKIFLIMNQERKKIHL